MTLLAGVSCARAIRRVTGLDARLKWPNDIFIRGKKAAGILAEMEGENSRLHFVILGIGINVNWEAEGMPADLRETATSLCAEAGREFDRAGPRPERRWRNWKRITPFSGREDFRKRCGRSGAALRWESGNGRR